MQRKVSRRNLLGTLGATSAVVATSCQHNPPNIGGKGGGQNAACTATLTLNRVNLICHGQMLFLYDPAVADSLKILIAAPPLEPGGSRELHKIYLGGLQGMGNVLPQPPYPVAGPKQFSYNLVITAGQGTAFSRQRSAFRGGPRSGEDVVLKDPMSKLTDNRVARYTITVPYPSDVRRFDVMDLLGNGPFGGTAASDLGILPRYMAGVHVLTYDDAIGPVNLVGPSSYPLGSATNGLNVHLYSQPDNVNDVAIGNHLVQFNGLTSYHSGGMTKPVDLTDLMRRVNHLKNGLPPDLCDQDVMDLYDLISPSVLKKGAEPVDCLQGWGT